VEFPPSVLEKKVQKGVREPGTMSEVVLSTQILQSASVVPLGSSGREFEPEFVLEKGVRGACRKFLYKRRSCVTGKPLHHTL